MTVISGMDIGFISLVRNDAVPELSQEIQGALQEAEVTLNARAHIAPEALQQMAETAIADACHNQQLEFEMLSTQAFKPGRPEPIHRMSS